VDHRDSSPGTLLTTDPHLELLLRAGLWFVTGHELLPGDRKLPTSREAMHQLILKAVEQKVLPLLVAYLRGAGHEVVAALCELEFLLRVRMEAFYAAVEPVLERVATAGIDLLLLKGGDLAVTVYPSGLPRMMEDLDVLAVPTDLQEVERALQNEGFAQGTVSSTALTVAPLTAAQLVSYRAMNHYELPTYSKFVELPDCAPLAERTSKYLRPFGYWMPVVGRKAYVPVDVDVHFNVARDIDLDDVWRAPRPLTLPSGRQVAGQSPTDMLWFLTSRVYHEVMQADTGVLLQFIDVLSIIKRYGAEIDWERVQEIGVKYGLLPSFFYVFAHVNECLGPVVPSTLIDACYPAHHGARRPHDWGDFMPKLLGGVMISRLF
jgi:hypothetical protein